MPVVAAGGAVRAYVPADGPGGMAPGPMCRGQQPEGGGCLCAITIWGMHMSFVSQLHGGVTREEEETLQKDSECRSPISRHNLLAGLGAVLILGELQMWACT